MSPIARAREALRSIAVSANDQDIIRLADAALAELEGAEDPYEAGRLEGLEQAAKECDAAAEARARSASAQISHCDAGLAFISNAQEWQARHLARAIRTLASEPGAKENEP